MANKSQLNLYGHLATFCAMVIIQLSCTKFVQIPPPTTAIAGTTVYSNGTSAAAVMTGLYSNATFNPGLSDGGNSIGLFMGLAADEFTNYYPNRIVAVQFYENALTSFSNNKSNYYFWTELYNDIYTTNAVLDGLANSSGVTLSAKQRISGEAEFMRAFYDFYATNLYGDVPLVTTTNYLVNNTILRTPQAQVYEQIISDLKEAQLNLSNEFVDALGNSTTERTRPNQGTATALLARVYLYTDSFPQAETEATEIIKNSSEYSLDSLSTVFLANSTEAIWQLQPSNPGQNTRDATNYVLNSVPNRIALSPYLLNSFEPGDERLSSWIGAFTSDSINYY